MVASSKRCHRLAVVYPPGANRTADHQALSWGRRLNENERLWRRFLTLNISNKRQSTWHEKYLLHRRLYIDDVFSATRGRARRSRLCELVWSVQLDGSLLARTKRAPEAIASEHQQTHWSSIDNLFGLTEALCRLWILSDLEECRSRVLWEFFCSGLGNPTEAENKEQRRIPLSDQNLPQTIAQVNAYT